MNRHLHFCVVTSSGTFAPDDDDGRLVFFQATKLTTKLTKLTKLAKLTTKLTKLDNCSFESLTEIIRRRILRYPVREDLLDERESRG